MRELVTPSRDPWRQQPPLPSIDALRDMGHELVEAPDPEMAIEGRHILTGRVVAQAESIDDLLLDVLIQRISQRLQQAR